MFCRSPPPSRGCTAVEQPGPAPAPLLPQVLLEPPWGHSSSFLAALSQIMLFVDGMMGVIQHPETVRWLYTLTGSPVSEYPPCRQRTFGMPLSVSLMPWLTTGFKSSVFSLTSSCGPLRCTLRGELGKERMAAELLLLSAV